MPSDLPDGMDGMGLAVVGSNLKVVSFIHRFEKLSEKPPNTCKGRAKRRYGPL